MADYNSFFSIVNGRPVIIDDEALQKHWDESKRNDEFLNSNFKELLKQYPDRWVAVYLEKVVATDVTQKGLLKKLDELGLRRNGVVDRFMDTDPRPWIL